VNPQPRVQIFHPASGIDADAVGQAQTDLRRRILRAFVGGVTGRVYRPRRCWPTSTAASRWILVGCEPAALDQVMAVFTRHGFGDSAVVGSMQARANGAALLEVR